MDDLEEIQKAAQRSADLTRQLLAFARKQTVAPKVLDLNDTVAGMLKMLRRLIGEDIDLAWMPGAGLWPVKMDPSQIDQILANLCVNARDAIAGWEGHHRDGKRHLRRGLLRRSPGFRLPGDYVLLAVSDDGCGMSQEVLEHLFEPFFTTKEVGKGTGLGLATVYGIVKQNEGFINVYSEPGKGTDLQDLPAAVRWGSRVAERPKIRRKRPRAAGRRCCWWRTKRRSWTWAGRCWRDWATAVLTAATPGEALRQARAHAAEIQSADHRRGHAGDERPGAGETDQ